MRPTRRRALEIAKPYLTAKYEAYRAWGQDTALPPDETFDLPFEQLLQDRFVIGTPDDCLRELLGWRTISASITSSFGRSGAGCRWKPRSSQSICSPARSSRPFGNDDGPPQTIGSCPTDSCSKCLPSGGGQSATKFGSGR